MLYKNQYRIEPARRPGWDYGNDAFYFVTICTGHRRHWFGEIVGEIPPVETRFIASLQPRMVLSDVGHIAAQIWNMIPQQFPFVQLDEFVVMPNHVHGIIQIAHERRDAIHRVSDDGHTDGRDAIHRVSDGQNSDINAYDRDAMNRVSTGGVTGDNNPMKNKNSISYIMRWYKGRVTFETKQLPNVNTFGWQTRFHDHIIRTETDLENIRQYIRHNPANWATDANNTNAPPSGG